MKENILHIAIAESSPIVSAGLTHTVGRLPGIPAHAIELNTLDHLYECLASEHVEILIVNPYFEESFDIRKVRELQEDIKIVELS